MFDEIFFYVFMGISLLHIVHIGVYIVGANLYDIKKFKTGRSTIKRRSRSPLVTIVIPAYNEEIGIIKTLNSVRKSSYRRIQIVVVDDGSRDNTAAAVRQYIRTHYRLDTKIDTIPGSRVSKIYDHRKHKKSLDITLISQKNFGKGTAVNNGIKNAARGSLVMTLDADSVLDKHAIKNAVRYFEDPKIVGVAANVRVIGDRNTLGVLQKIEHIIGYRTKKFFSVANCEFVIGGVASTYRMKTLKEVGYYDTDTITEDIGLSLKVVAQKGNLDWRIVYAVDVLAGTEGVQTYKALFKQRYRWKMGMLQNLIKNRSLLANKNKKYSKMLTFYRIPMAFFGEVILMIEPFILAYVLYLSVIHATVGVLLGAYVIVTLYVIWALLPDEHMSICEKFKYALLSPAMYFIFYIMNAVQVAAVMRCLFNYKLVVGKEKTDGRWTPPERASVLATSDGMVSSLSSVSSVDDGDNRVSAVSSDSEIPVNIITDYSNKDMIALSYTQKPFKHQEYFLTLQNRVSSVADLQIMWHEYYSSLSDREKNEVWQEFYLLQSQDLISANTVRTLDGAV